MMKPVAACLVLFAACGSSSSSVDAPPGSRIDAAVGGPDAPITTVDAPITTVDARPGTADAPSTGGPDAPPAATCLPDCYISAVTPLVSACPGTLPCTMNFDPQTLTTTTCYYNGVKRVSMIGASGITTTVKNASGVCYTMVVNAPTETSGQILWKNASGTTVAEVDIPDTTMSNIENIICGGGSPIMIDLNSAACKAVEPDAGPGPDAGAVCTMDASCVP